MTTRGDSQTQSAGGPGGTELAGLVREVLEDFIADPLRNTQGPGTDEPAWESYLLGFARGDDPLWDDLKNHAGTQHWTPAEAFAASGADCLLHPAELTVISWAVCQTEATKAANRIETRMPSEPWARARIYGQEGNRALHLVLLDVLLAAGYEAVAPSLLPAWSEARPHTDHWSSTWSERHVAYVSGLGTFGLSGGLITAKGMAVRFGSVVVRAVAQPTLRPYQGPFEYCLHFNGGECFACVDRCPSGSVNVEGRDKEACAGLLRRSEDYVRLHYGFDGYGCGLCQTAVPCESGIPEGLSRAEGAAP